MRPSRYKIAIDRWSPLLLLLWVALNFAWTIPFGLSNDDSMWIYGAFTGPKDVRALINPPVFGVFLRPLVQASFVLNYAVGGTRPETYRMLNIGAHAAVVLLLWWVLRRLVGGGWPPLVAAAAFAVHPDCAPAVVWVSGRTEVLCALFYVAAVAAHLGQRRTLGVICFAIALAAKETATSLPLLLAGLVWLQARGATAPDEAAPSRGRELMRLWPYGVVLALYLLVRAFMLVDFGLLNFASARQRITLVGQYLLRPLPVYGFWRSLLLLTVGPAVALWYTRLSPASYRLGVRAGLLWAGVTLLPYVPWFTFLPWYTYLPSMGMSLAFVALGADVLRRAPKRAAALLASAAVALWLGASVGLLQAANDHLRLAGLRTEAVTAALVRAVGAPRPMTVFVLNGFERDVMGVGSGRGGTPVLVFGLTEALRMRMGNVWVDVEHGDRSHAELRALQRPVVLLEWDEGRQEFRRTWQSF